MTTNSKNPKKKMLDISRPKTNHSAHFSYVKEKKIVPPKVEKNIEKELQKLDKETEKFIKEETYRFKKEEQLEKKAKSRKKKIKNYIFSAVILILLAAAVYASAEFLPKAEIKIITKKTEWNFTDSITANKNIAQIDIFQKQIPAEVFSARKNFNFSFSATGKKSVQQKAKGKIIIYNAYSSSPQILIANTRFLAPDGKIFRLEERVVVPGAKLVEGKITPSSIEAKVVADQPGSQYNIGPVSHFSIPGFQGTEKYQGFYAESKEPMKGGFIGEKAFPTDEDIKKAKEKAEQDLKSYIESFLSLQIPQEFKIIDGSRQFNILKEEVNKETDEKGNFTFFAEGESLIIGFRENDIKNLLENIAQKELGARFRLKDYKLEYEAGKPDFSQGHLSFAVNFQGIFEEPVDIESLKQQILNKNEKELKNLISAFPNIQKTTISFWPFWVKRVPDDLRRVKIEVE